ncbi:hypothetical protein [Mucilaginibacter ginkgonis]|uniref:Glycoside hydrolase family 42 N-terminal domain-containing protein n=1 Tax=Mucilaginibacter ginkgonis TaxID=2682091 RepID=A0A6I4HZN4_9SPHI|nr:hypothetical protein [Mucilaginibacter ginkgonis]QQL48677.1 hypothetical protein GO620_010850 [Mucilaginibacter ginkgonis]
MEQLKAPAIKKSWIYRSLFLLVLVSVFAYCSKKAIVDPVSNEGVGGNTGSLESNGIPLKNMFGVNGYEWNIEQNPNDVNDNTRVYEPKWALIKGFGSFRHYMDWEKLEQTQGKYTFNPTHSGGWFYDVMYQRGKQDSVLMLADLKTVPGWFLNAYYPADQRDNEDTPAPYTSDKSNPSSYLLQAKVAFQFAARYGSNAAIDRSLMSIDASQRWTGDEINEIKVGLNYVKYIECDNERDKWWKGAKAQQTAQEYAANMSAFYDGNKGKMGKGVGVKSADPNMLVVMGGLAHPDVQYVKDMVEWCRANRGYRADGSVDLCFDVINYHYYSNNASLDIKSVATKAMAPELSIGGKVADDFVALGKTLHLPVWVTESSYDTQSSSPQGAFVIGNRSIMQTQADWTLRTSLMYARHGVERVFYFQMYDDAPGGGWTYQTSGLVNDNNTRRIVADYMLQVSKIMGNYAYNSTISADPLVDRYVYGNKVFYALMIPDQMGRTGTYTLDLGNASQAAVYTLKDGAADAVKTVMNTTGGKLTLTVTETPVFVQPL